MNEVLTTPQVSEELGSCTLIQHDPTGARSVRALLAHAATLRDHGRSFPHSWRLSQDDGQMPNGHAVKARRIGTHDPIVYTYHTFTRVQKNN